MNGIQHSYVVSATANLRRHFNDKIYLCYFLDGDRQLECPPEVWWGAPGPHLGSAGSQPAGRQLQPATTLCELCCLHSGAGGYIRVQVGRKRSTSDNSGVQPLRISQNYSTRHDTDPRTQRCAIGYFPSGFIHQNNTNTVEARTIMASNK